MYLHIQICAVITVDQSYHPYHNNNNNHDKCLLSQYILLVIIIIIYSVFIDKKVIHFSAYNCERSISNIINDSKTSQRKPWIESNDKTAFLNTSTPNFKI